MEVKRERERESLEGDAKYVRAAGSIPTEPAAMRKSGGSTSRRASAGPRYAGPRYAGNPTPRLPIDDFSGMKPPTEPAAMRHARNYLKDSYAPLPNIMTSSKGAESSTVPEVIRDAEIRGFEMALVMIKGGLLDPAEDVVSTEELTQRVDKFSPFVNMSADIPAFASFSNAADGAVGASSLRNQKKPSFTSTALLPSPPSFPNQSNDIGFSPSENAAGSTHVADDTIPGLPSVVAPTVTERTIKQEPEDSSIFSDDSSLLSESSVGKVSESDVENFLTAPRKRGRRIGKRDRKKMTQTARMLRQKHRVETKSFRRKISREAQQGLRSSDWTPEEHKSYGEIQKRQQKERQQLSARGGNAMKMAVWQSADGTAPGTASSNVVAKTVELEPEADASSLSVSIVGNSSDSDDVEIILTAPKQTRKQKKAAKMISKKIQKQAKTCPQILELGRKHNIQLIEFKQKIKTQAGQGLRSSIWTPEETRAYSALRSRQQKEKIKFIMVELRRTEVSAPAPDPNTQQALSIEANQRIQRDEQRSQEKEEASHKHQATLQGTRKATQQRQPTRQEDEIRWEARTKELQQRRKHPNRANDNFWKRRALEEQHREEVIKFHLSIGGRDALVDWDIRKLTADQQEAHQNLQELHENDWSELPLRGLPERMNISKEVEVLKEESGNQGPEAVGTSSQAPGPKVEKKSEWTRTQIMEWTAGLEGNANEGEEQGRSAGNSSTVQMDLEAQENLHQMPVQAGPGALNDVLDQQVPSQEPATILSRKRMRSAASDQSHSPPPSTKVCRLEMAAMVGDDFGTWVGDSLLARLG